MSDGESGGGMFSYETRVKWNMRLARAGRAFSYVTVARVLFFIWENRKTIVEWLGFLQGLYKLLADETRRDYLAHRGEFRDREHCLPEYKEEFDREHDEAFARSMRNADRNVAMMRYVSTLLVGSRAERKAAKADLDALGAEELNPHEASAVFNPRFFDLATVHRLMAERQVVGTDGSRKCAPLIFCDGAEDRTRGFKSRWYSFVVPATKRDADVIRDSTLTEDADYNDVTQACWKANNFDGLLARCADYELTLRRIASGDPNAGASSREGKAEAAREVIARYAKEASDFEKSYESWCRRGTDRRDAR